MPDLDRTIAGLRCRDLLTLLTDYVDGDLAAEVVANVNAHLTGCAACAKFGGEYGALVRELRTRLREQSVARDVEARLASRLAAVWAEESEERSDPRQGET